MESTVSGPLTGAALRAHIDGVVARVARAAAGEPHGPALRAAALVHEEAPARFPTRLAANEAEHAPLVAAIVAGFGALWKARDPDGVADYVARHRAHLAPLLLFELAHEGAPTALMRAAARQGGLDQEFEAWVERLGGDAGQGGRA